MKIEKLDLHNLRNDTHFQYYTDFRKLTERHQVVKLKIQSLYDSFIALYNDEDTAFKKISKSVYTSEIKNADRYRNKIWRGMINAVKSAMQHYGNDVQRAAIRLKIVFDAYGYIIKKPFNDKTGAIYNLLQELRGEYAADAAKAGLTGWIDELEIANETFERLMMNRYDETTAKTDLVMRQVRVKIDGAYRIIIERINAAIVMEGEEQYREFVATLNTIIKKYADILAQRKGRAAAKKEKKEEKKEKENKE
jgi:hypothetical protein